MSAPPPPLRHVVYGRALTQLRLASAVAGAISRNEAPHPRLHKSVEKNERAVNIAEGWKSGWWRLEMLPGRKGEGGGGERRTSEANPSPSIKNLPLAVVNMPPRSNSPLPPPPPPFSPPLFSLAHPPLFSHPSLPFLTLFLPHPTPLPCLPLCRTYREVRTPYINHT